MFVLTQRQINHGVFGLLTIISCAILLLIIFTEPSLLTVLPTLVTCAVCGGLWLAYWRGWETARPVLIAVLTCLVCIGLPQEGIQANFNHSVYVIPALALVLTGPVWIVGSGCAVLAALIYRAQGGPYLNPVDLMVFVLIIGGMVFSRLAVDAIARVEQAKRDAEAAQARAEQRERELAEQTLELTQRNAEQERLIDLVATLETPTIQLTDDMLLAPVVGHLDSRRAQALTQRLLECVHTQRVRKVVLDISGVTVVDTAVAQALVNTTQALRLLGTQVALTGIQVEMAQSLTQLGVDFGKIETARSPQEIILKTFR
jgi:anti-anti-sigma factor